MFIYNNIIWEKKDGQTHLWIHKPSAFLGKEDDPMVADIKAANLVGDPDILRERLAQVEEVAADPTVMNFTVQLADDASGLRGYGGGLAVVGTFGEEQPTLYLPHRDLGAPGDRLIWDLCAGRTTRKDESPHWLHRMVTEGLEEITFTINDKLVVPEVEDGLRRLSGLDTSSARAITGHNAVLLGLAEREVHPATFSYRAPANATVIHEQQADGSYLTFLAGWGLEPKFSGLELMSYATLDFGTSEGSTTPFDSEEMAPGKLCGREIHALDPFSGKIEVYHNGALARASSVADEVGRRNRIRADPNSHTTRGYQVPIPAHSASIKADLLTKQDAWPYTGNVSALGNVRFGIDPS